MFQTLFGAGDSEIIVPNTLLLTDYCNYSVLKAKKWEIFLKNKCSKRKEQV